MTKQEKIRKELEEIREGIKELIDNNYNARNPSYPELIAFQPMKFLNELLPYLHSQGCVLKVDRELPENPHRRSVEEEGMPEDKWSGRIVRSNILICDDAQEDMLKAGYVAVEPLVKEVENGE